MVGVASGSRWEWGNGMASTETFPTSASLPISLVSGMLMTLPKGKEQAQAERVEWIPMLSSRIEKLVELAAAWPPSFHKHLGSPGKGPLPPLRQLKTASFPATIPLGLFSRRLLRFQGTFGRRTASPARGPPLQRRDPAKTPRRPRETRGSVEPFPGTHTIDGGRSRSRLSVHVAELHVAGVPRQAGSSALDR